MDEPEIESGPWIDITAEVTQANPADEPKPTGHEEDISLTGAMFPTEGPQLTIVQFTGEQLYLPVFRDGEDLRRIMERIGVHYDGVKQVKDGAEFLSSLPEGIALAIDIYFTDEGRVRWLQVG